LDRIWASGGAELAVAHAITRSVRDSATLLDATSGTEIGDYDILLTPTMCTPLTSWAKSTPEHSFRPLEQNAGLGGDDNRDGLAARCFVEIWRGFLQVVAKTFAEFCRSGHRVEAFRIPRRRMSRPSPGRSPNMPATTSWKFHAFVVKAIRSRPGSVPTSSCPGSVPTSS
jgi:Asp-tRNA(Asn)/Glu-tRNA(Gln) amidotransferase A subunit family amidase